MSRKNSGKNLSKYVELPSKKVTLKSLMKKSEKYQVKNKSKIKEKLSKLSADEEPSFEFHTGS